MTDLWPALEPLLRRIERPARYLNREWGSVHDADATFAVALMYPDTYEIGQANQAIAILASALRTLPDTAVERVFLPWKDLSDLMRQEDLPLFSLESCAPVRDFDVLGITLPHELAATNMLEALDLAGIPLRASARGEDEPFVIGGGPVAFNPEPVATFFDAILIGEGEEAALEIVSAIRTARERGLSRPETLDALAQVSGVYVPSLYRPFLDEKGRFAGVEASEPAPEVVVKRIVADLDAVPVPTQGIVPFMDVVHDRVAIEVLRGCTRGCRFCQAGMIYRPVRERTPDTIVRSTLDSLACTGYDEVSLTSLSTTDHSRLEEILRRLTRRLEGTGVGISLPSQRVDSFGISMARMIATNRKSGITLAPEAGTQRMRDVINKGVTEEGLLEAIADIFSSGWRRVKLYFMIGLPGETDDDVRGIGDLAAKALAVARETVEPAQRGSVKIAVSVATFVPKAGTPFQWEPQISFEEIERRHRILRESTPRKGVDLQYHDSKTSFVEGALALGGREMADVIEAAWRRGARFDAWTEEFSLARWVEAADEVGISLEALANEGRDTSDPLPWGHITSGVSTRYLLRERERALRAELTPDCSFERCTGCDVCGDLGVDVVLAGDAR